MVGALDFKHSTEFSLPQENEKVKYFPNSREAQKMWEKSTCV